MRACVAQAAGFCPAVSCSFPTVDSLATGISRAPLTPPNRPRSVTEPSGGLGELFEGR